MYIYIYIYIDMCVCVCTILSYRIPFYLSMKQYFFLYKTLEPFRPDRDYDWQDALFLELWNDITCTNYTQWLPVLQVCLQMCVRLLFICHFIDFTSFG